MKRSIVIRQMFFDHFKQFQSHRIVSPSKLLTNTTTLFTIAGMQQFTDIFLGHRPAQWTNLCTIQPCLRISGKQNDISEVGKTNRHNTFFEMMGNFSFGGYWKREAINICLDFLIKVGLKIENMFFTVHISDIESYNIWKEKSDNVIQLEDNLWSAGDGPSGPCTEIFYTKYPMSIKEIITKMNENSGDLKEIWNIVFISNINGENQFIDTGMGIERLLSVMEGHFDNFQTDLLKPIVEIANCETEVNKKISADFMKSCIFLMEEGLLPGNNGPAYVLKQLVKKVTAICNNWKEVGQRVISTMGDVYNLNIDFVPIFESVIKNNKDKSEIISSYSSITEEKACFLHQTYGISMNEILHRFPGLDTNKINDIENKHKITSKQKIEVKYFEPTFSKCYEFTSLESNIEHIEIHNDKILIITKESCFYPTGGGQEGDKGKITVENQCFYVENTIKQLVSNSNFVIIHICIGEILENLLGKRAILEVDVEWRKSHARSHSCTHLIGEYLMRNFSYKQKGSFAGEDYWRLDLEGDKIGKKIDLAINWAISAINENVKCTTIEKDISHLDNSVLLLENRIPTGIVRIVQFGDYSKQLCGGTHVKEAGEIQAISFEKEQSIGASIRRISFFVGKKARL